MHKYLALALASTVALSACANNPRVAEGAAVGAAGGAVVGAVAGAAGDEEIAKRVCITVEELEDSLTDIARSSIAA